MRKFLWPVAVVAVLVIAVLIWRVRHPKLSDEEQIAANLDGICAAAANRSPRAIAAFLANDFTLGDLKKSEFQNSLAGGILQYRVIELTLPGTKSTVTGETATSEGGYVLSLKPEFNSSPEVQRGRFKLRWKKVDGQWLISGADVDNPLLH